MQRTRKHSEKDIIWPEFDESIRDFLLNLLHEFKIAIPSKGRSLIPSLLSNAPDLIIEGHKLIMRMDFNKPIHFTSLLFPNIIATSHQKLFEFLDDKKPWRDAIFFYNQEEKKYLLLKCQSDSIKMFGDSDYLAFRLQDLIQKQLNEQWKGKDKRFNFL
jgi:hypothetical protein